MIQWPDALVSDIARRQCVIYLGSGASKNSVNAAGEHPKTWDEFLRFALSKITNPSEYDLVKSKIDSGDLLMACELVRDIMDRESFNRLLKTEFQQKKFRVAEIHRRIFALDARIVATPNFDQIYETFVKSETQGNVTVKNYYDEDIANCIRNPEYVILKLHGSIETPNKMVFSQIDYARVRNSHQDFYQILNALITTQTFMFIGAGLNDPDIRLMLENYAFQYQWSRKHYFVIPQAKLTDRERAIYSESLNLEFILYDDAHDHKELTEAIGELVSLVENERGMLSASQRW